MRTINRSALRREVAALALLAALAGAPRAAPAAASVAIAISPSTLTWSTVNDFTTQFLAPDNGSILVTGTLVTGSAAGNHTSTISVTAPASVLGAVAGNAIPIGAFHMTCSGTSNGVAPVYAAADTALTASSSTVCATWTTARNTTITLNFTIQIFLDDRSFPADTYSSAGFKVVGSAV